MLYRQIEKFFVKPLKLQINTISPECTPCRSILCSNKFYAALKNAAFVFFYVNKSFSLTVSIITAVNTQNLTFLAFTCVMNFQIRNFVRLQKVVCKNAEGKFYVLNVIHVMRHIYMTGTNLLLKDKLAF